MTDSQILSMDFFVDFYLVVDQSPLFEFQFDLVIFPNLKLDLSFDFMVGYSTLPEVQDSHVV